MWIYIAHRHEHASNVLASCKLVLISVK